MTNTSVTPTMKLFDNMLRHSIGFDSQFFDRIADTPNFPPHTIEQYSEDNYILTLAVAGFAEADIEITVHNDLLTVSGKRQSLPDRLAHRENGYRMLYSGIGFRDFSRQFKMGEHVIVDNATLRDGLLQIDLVRRIPDSAKARRIEIGLSKARIKAA